MSIIIQSPPFHEDEIVHWLSVHPFVQEVTRKEGGYRVKLSVNEAAIELLIRFLQTPGVVHAEESPREKTTVYLRSNETSPEKVKSVLYRAFGKVSQYLEYLELKKDYAAGQIPLHLSQWLVEGNG